MMRNWMIGLSVLVLVGSAPSANADLITKPRPGLATTTTEPSDQANANPSAAIEDALNLTAAKRRLVQRKLTKLGFKSKANGRFDEPTRGAITHWQESRNIPATGFLDAEQYQALTGQDVASADVDADRPHHSRGGRRSSRGGGGGGPIGAIGGAVVGLFHRL